MGIRLIHKGQSGFTLVELLIAIALTALITTGVTMAIGQTFTGSTRSVNHMVAVRQVQEAGYWIAFYAYAGQGLTTTGESSFPLVVNWIDFDGNARHKIVFSLNSSGLQASYYVDEVLDPEQTGRVPVFQFINNPDTTNCRVSGGSSFGLPDIGAAGDAFTITGSATPDNGMITVVSGSISFATTGGATCSQVATNPYVMYEWTTPTEGSSITITATSTNTRGSWTSKTKAAAAAITVDNGENPATLNDAQGLILTITAAVGIGEQQIEETRVYEIVPKPSS
jgi:prepilin-type N-terminal cleavage/methylation domain-containing protein